MKIKSDLTGSKSFNSQISTIPVDFEPLRSFRFNVSFPKKFNVSDFIVRKVNLPSYKPGFFKSTYGDLEIEFINLITPNTIDLIEKFKNEKFKIEISMIDPLNEVINNFIIEISKVKSISYSELNYMSDDLSLTTVVFKIKNFNSK